MRISVMVPSYRRPILLRQCLEAIRVQARPADQVLVVVRHDDYETLSALQTRSHDRQIEVVKVSQPGVVHAMSMGLTQSEGDVVAFTDDDAAPRTDWLARIEERFAANPILGGVGGRDWLNHNGIVETGKQNLVGRVLWYGRIVGNHHLGFGAAREVDILKGVNCAFRTDAVRSSGFKTRLRGGGAQVHWEMCLCLALRRAGWRLVYDPAIAVDHYPAPRFDRDERNKFDALATSDAAYNFHIALSELSPPWKRLAAFAWQYSVGTSGAPGIVNLLRMLAKRDPNAFTRYRATLNGFARLRP